MGVYRGYAEALKARREKLFPERQQAEHEQMALDAVRQVVGKQFLSIGEEQVGLVAKATEVANDADSLDDLYSDLARRAEAREITTQQWRAEYDDLQRVEAAIRQRLAVIEQRKTNLAEREDAPLEYIDRLLETYPALPRPTFPW